MEMMRCPSASRLPVAKEERNAGPAPVVDEALQRDEGLGIGLRVDAVFGSVADVLPANDIGRLNRIMLRKTLFFSSLMGFGSSEVGGSIAMNARI